MLLSLGIILLVGLSAAAIFERIGLPRIIGMLGVGIAVSPYALNERKYLYTFLENGDVPIDNNIAENAIRPFAVGRKNWLFSNTSNGAKGSAALYSIISTAQANGLDAEKYLTDLLRHPAGTILFPWDQ